MNYIYGKKEDVKRLNLLGGGNHLCKLNKMPQGHLDSMEKAQICDIDHPLASTVTARYYKGVGSHKDNMVICRKK